MIYKMLQWVTGLVIAVGLFSVPVLSEVLFEQTWETHESPFGGRTEIRTVAGEWQESIDYDAQGNKVRHRYWDAMRVMHDVEYEPESGEVINRERRE